MLNICKRFYLILFFNFFLYSINGFFRPFGLPSFKFIHLKNSNHQDTDNLAYAEEYYNFLLEFNKLPEEQPKILLGDASNNFSNLIKDRYKNYKIFEKNLIFINDFNNKNNSFSLGINQFADSYNFQNNNLIETQINDLDILKNNVKQIITSPLYYFEKYRNLPASLIWNNSIVSKVKNQEECGSCWAFSTTGAIEAKMRINNISVDRLSEQELVDCSKQNSGCNGGLMHLAFDYCIENKGLMSNNDYNYTAKQGECLIDCNLNNSSKVIGSDIKDYKFTIPRSVIDLKASLKNGPICIALDASPLEFRFYKEGIIDLNNKNTSKINHAVLLVGYQKYDNGSYWIIQNSWGEKWGEKGYGKIKIQNGDGILLTHLYGVYPE